MSSLDVLYGKVAVQWMHKQQSDKKIGESMRGTLCQLGRKGPVPSHEVQLALVRELLRDYPSFGIARDLWGASIGYELTSSESGESIRDHSRRIRAGMAAAIHVAKLLKRLDVRGWSTAHALILRKLGCWYYPLYPLPEPLIPDLSSILVMPNVQLLCDLVARAQKREYKSNKFRRGMQLLLAEAESKSKSESLPPYCGIGFEVFRNSLLSSDYSPDHYKAVIPLHAEKNAEVTKSFAWTVSPRSNTLPTTPEELLRGHGLDETRLSWWVFPDFDRGPKCMWLAVYPEELHEQVSGLVGIVPAMGTMHGFGACLVHGSEIGTNVLDTPGVLKFGRFD